MTPVQFCSFIAATSRPIINYPDLPYYCLIGQQLITPLGIKNERFQINSNLQKSSGDFKLSVKLSVKIDNLESRQTVKVSLEQLREGPHSFDITTVLKFG